MIYLCFPPQSHLTLVWWVLIGGWIVGWVGQLSVLEPWNVTTLAVPRLLKHLHVASICNMGINSVLQPPVLYVQCILSEIKFSHVKTFFLGKWDTAWSIPNNPTKIYQVSLIVSWHPFSFWGKNKFSEQSTKCNALKHVIYSGLVFIVTILLITRY